MLVAVKRFKPNRSNKVTRLESTELVALQTDVALANFFEASVAVTARTGALDAPTVPKAERRRSASAPRTMPLSSINADFTEAWISPES